MPFTGNTYTAPSSPGAFNPAIEGQAATAMAWNTLLADFETAFSACQVRAGLTATQTFLSGDVTLNNIATLFSGPTTGAIGASGQNWLVIATFIVTDTGNAANFVFEIYNGSASLSTGGVSTTAANAAGCCTLIWAGTLAAATTFTGRVKDVTTATGILLRSQTGATTANKSSNIVAIRLT